MGFKFATETAHVTLADGRGAFVAQGSVWDADDEVVALYPHFFADAPEGGVQRSSPVEVADDVPGVKRAVKKAASKKAAASQGD